MGRSCHVNLRWREDKIEKKLNSNGRWMAQGNNQHKAKGQSRRGTRVRENIGPCFFFPPLSFSKWFVF